MNILTAHVIHQALFGGLAAAGFGVLFNSPPRMLGFCFGSGALALAVRTFAQGHGMSLPVASFVAALTLAMIDRAWQKDQTPRGSVLAVVGCIAMVPGGLAEKALMGLMALVHTPADHAVMLLTSTVGNLIITTFTLVAIGVGLCIPALISPQKKER